MTGPATMTDTWNPDRYEQFRDERSRPFYDLLALVEPIPGGRAIDLGCGTGELTRELHRRAQAAETIGIDNSPAMLDRATPFAGAGLRFEARDIAALADGERFDLIFSNAALQWTPDHPRLVPWLAGHLNPGGQLAIQLPSMEGHPQHQIAAQVAGQAPFRDQLGGFAHHLEVLPPERYSEILFALGFVRQNVRLQMYPHRLADVDAAVDWARGTLLTSYQRRLSPEQFEAYVAEYRRQLKAAWGDPQPCLLVYQRLLIWGRR